MKRYLLLSVFIILIAVVMAVRVADIRQEAARQVYNLARIHAKDGIPVVTMTAQRNNEIFFRPMTLQQGPRPGVFMAYLGRNATALFRPGGKVILSWKGKEYEGRIENISSRIDLNVGLYPVTVSMRVPGLEELPFYEADGESEVISNQIVLPRTLIVSEPGILGQGSTFVWVVRDNKAWRQEVTLLVVGAYRVAVADGLREGDQVIISDTISLSEGMLVQSKSNR